MLTTKAKEVERVLQCDLQHFAIEQMSLGQRKALNDNVEVTLDLTKKKTLQLNYFCKQNCLEYRVG